MSDNQKLLSKTESLLFLLKQLSGGLSLEDSRKKLSTAKQDEEAHQLACRKANERIRLEMSQAAFDAAGELRKTFEGPDPCTCSKKECAKCFYAELVKVVRELKSELFWATKDADHYRNLIYTQYYTKSDSGEFKKVGDWKPDPNIWPLATKEEI